jgi:hypothetical protein
MFHYQVLVLFNCMFRPLLGHHQVVIKHSCVLTVYLYTFNTCDLPKNGDDSPQSSSTQILKLV